MTYSSARDHQPEYLEGTLKVLAWVLPLALAVGQLAHPSWPSVVFVGLLEFGVVAVFLLLRSGRTRAAAWAGAVGTGLALVGATPLFGGITGTAPIGFPVLVLLISMVLGARASTWGAVVVSVVMVGLFVVEEWLGWVPLGYATRLDHLVSLLSLVVVVAALTNLKLAQHLADAEQMSRLLADRDRELTLRREAQEELRRAMDRALAASQAKNDFLANMSHELRTPLNAIIGYSEMLLEEADDLNGPDLSRILSSGQHLLSLIDDLLDLAKIEAGRLRVDPEFVDLQRLLTDIVQAMRPAVARRRNEFRVEMPAHLGAIHTDPTRIRQVLLNLLSNASKFTEDGTVTLRVQEAVLEGRDVIRFEVEDTGIGIAPEVLQRLFEPFVQGDSSTRRRYGGSGLGLALSSRLATMLEGSIDVDSEPGQGSRFALTVPRMAAASTVTIGRADRAERPEAGGQ